MARNKELLEKIEMLQNIMLASIVGGERDDSGYVALREELLANQVIKEALPRFVRTCRDLGQFWNFIKLENSLPSYATRREFVWRAFRPVLDGIDEASSEREQFFAKGSDHDAYVAIRTILQEAKSELLIIDPYMDGTIYQLLGTLSISTLIVKILSAKIPSDFALEARKFVAQHPEFTIEIRVSNDFHDRFVFLDGNRCHLLGASIKDAGKRGFTVVQLIEPTAVQFILDYANRVWNLAALASP